MKTISLKSFAALGLSLGLLLTHSISATAQTSAFTYQGRLDAGGNPASGLYDLRFALFDAASGGTQQGTALTNTATAVTNGLFTVTLDFGNQFPGADRWLELGVRTNGGGAFATLSPRQQITATPYAIRAASAGTVAATGITGTLAPAQLPAAVVTNTATGVSLTGTFTGDGAGLTNLPAWRLGGNAGTTPGVNFLGTTDNQPLEIRVNNLLALRLVDPGDSADGNTLPDGAPNVVGGAPVNFVGLGVVGATISGGGATNYAGTAYTNRVLADFGTVGGGGGNTASGSRATVGGGLDNTASGEYATVPGGRLNSATHYAFAAGRRAKANHTGAFVWADSTDADIASTNANSMTFRASGGVRFFSNSGATTGVSLAANGTAWAMISDRNVKKDFEPVNCVEVLEKLAALPITRWRYHWESNHTTPHLGPMAQDFKAAFYPGTDDKSITTQEADGVALAAIQGLNQKVEDLKAEVRQRDAENAALKARLERLEQLLTSQLTGGAK